MDTPKVLGKSFSRLAAVAMVISMGTASVAFAADKKAAAPSHPAPAAKAAPAARPAGGANTAARPATGSAAHGASGASTASHGPTANGPSANHPTTTGAKPTTTAGAAGHTAPSANTAANRAGGTGKTGGPGAASKQAGPIKTAAPKGSVEKTTKSGSAVRTRPNGKVSDVHDAKRNMDVHHGLDGSRRVSVERADHSHLVAERGRGGYVDRGYHYHGHDYAARSYYYHGHEYNTYYRGAYYGGVYVNVYAPGYYYSPGFYGWAYNPWAAPIAYGWGWGASPWVGYYGGFFTPYSVYPSAAFWLTDYIVSQNLQAAYTARAEANAAAAAASGEQAGAAPLTPEVKQMISDEVKAQLALENSESTQTAQKQDVDPNSSGIGRLLADGNPHVFVVGGSLDLTDAAGAECAVSDGDALQLVPPAPPNATAVNLVVLASKGGQECAPKNTVSVQVADLQDMQNHMRETIDQGLQELQAKQGKGGLPQAPPSAQAKPTPTEYAAIAPPPDPKDAADIAEQTKAADQAEAEVTKEAGADASATTTAAGGAATSAPAPTVALGQTPDEVTSILGKPTKTANLGSKQIYYYDGMKVTFKAGKVTDVE